MVEGETPLGPREATSTSVSRCQDLRRASLPQGRLLKSNNHATPLTVATAMINDMRRATSPSRPRSVFRRNETIGNRCHTQWAIR